MDHAPKCNAVYDRGEGERPRRVHCHLRVRHDGPHFATWGGSQQWRQISWGDKAVTDVAGLSSENVPTRHRVDCYQVSFGDRNAEEAFWQQYKKGYCIGLTSKDGTECNVEIVGVPAYDNDLGFVIEVRRWSDEPGKGVGQPFKVPTDDITHVHVW